MMSKYFSSNLIPSTLLLFGILLSQSALSNPIQYTFSQGGFTDGAMIIGRFTGEDLDQNGRLTLGLTTLPDEVSDFQLNFSGNKCNSLFQHQHTA